jgi:hypothetical protein
MHPLWTRIILMNADCTFNIGWSHSLCQDYVIARNASNRTQDPYVILSDGCSSSSDTDIGSRLLVKATETILPKCDVEDLHRGAAQVALGWANLLGIAPQSVDATLMTAHINGDNLFVACSGDGVIVLESHEGVLDVYEISSPSGYPFYPSYVHQAERLAELVKASGCSKEVKHYRRVSPDEHLTLLESTRSESLTEVLKLKVSDYKYAAVASDGIGSFLHTQKSTNGKSVAAVCVTDVFHEFWSFKNSHGRFVERRMKRFKKDSQAKGWQHADDLAVAVIHLGKKHVQQDNGSWSDVAVER